MTTHKLEQHPIHLGLGATAIELPTFTGDMEWYAEYGRQHGDDGAEGRLMSQHHFTEPWNMWEMHPHGSEVVVCITGEITLIQETADGEQKLQLEAGEYAINPPGVWHTADVDSPATALFITAGIGTEHRPR